MEKSNSPVARILKLLRLERTEISAIYFYAVMAGLIQLSLPLGVQSIVSFVLGGAMSTSLILLIVLVVIGVLATGLMYINQMKQIEKIQQKIFVRYSMEFTEHIPKIDLKKADPFYLPELVNRFFEIPALQKGLSKLLLDIPTATIQILFGLTLLSFYHPVFILFGIILIILLAAILYYSGSKGLSTSLEESRYKYQVAAWLEELARVVKSFKLSKGTSLHIKNSDTKIINYLHARKDHFKILLFQYRILVGLKTLITASMLIVGSYLLVNQQLNIGQFIAAEIVILIVISAVERIIGTLDSVYDILTSVEKIGKLTDKPIEHHGSQLLQKINEGVSVELKNLTFGFNDENNVINNISFRIEKGETVCISGNEGSGKSTLLKLMSGLFTDFNGQILIDDTPVQHYNLDSLRSLTGIYLSQQDIFNGTLMENISMGNETNQGEIIKLAEKIGLQSFIASLKFGFDTELDPVGNHLPGNIIRKILLLRALINSPRLILLEEPWFGFSDETKKNVQNILLQNSKNSTVVIISNDESFVLKCDKSIYLTEDKINIIISNTKK
ncbi:MAG: ATP-binding cassette domain-containing protein [Chitinophagaceae bacterium]|nr:ATP-binding cassette domain-containing protein [Chitinophagaceae bacterium]